MRGMPWRAALLAGVVVAGTTVPARAQRAGKTLLVTAQVVAAPMSITADLAAAPAARSALSSQDMVVQVSTDGAWILEVAGAQPIAAPLYARATRGGVQAMPFGAASAAPAAARETLAVSGTGSTALRLPAPLQRPGERGDTVVIRLAYP